MFLIRTAFWLTVVVALLPATPEAESSVQAPSTLETLAAAQAAVSDIRSICQREPQVCQTGTAAIALMSDKARNGAMMLYNLLDDAAKAPNTQGNASETLTDSDRQLMPVAGNGQG